MTLRQAFAQSVNSAAVRLAMTVGLDKVVAAARELGLDAPLTQVPSLALGSNEVSLLDLTGTLAAVRLVGLGSSPGESPLLVLTVAHCDLLVPPPNKASCHNGKR